MKMLDQAHRLKPQNVSRRSLLQPGHHPHHQSLPSSQRMRKKKKKKEIK
jgi:hypothetical protein